MVGDVVGDPVGDVVGKFVGAVVGDVVGATVGDRVGDDVVVAVVVTVVVGVVYLSCSVLSTHAHVEVGEYGYTCRCRYMRGCMGVAEFAQWRIFICPSTETRHDKWRNVDK